LTGPAKTTGLPPLRHQFLFFWALLCLIIIAYTDLSFPALLGQSDYLMTFHTAGYIAAHGLWDILYPPAGALSFAGAPFDKQAHALIATMPSWSVGEYMYMPVSAYVFAPLSLLPLRTSLVVWQMLSIAALFIGSKLALGSTGRAFLATCAAFTFIPVFFTIWIGQVGLVFGLLPLAAGYHLLRQKRYFQAGLVFALLSLKPQMLVPALFIVACALGRKNYMALAGLACGTATLAAVNYFVAGPSLCRAWLSCLALSDKIYSDPGQGVAVHLATSLPRAILLSQPLSAHPGIKPLLYLAAAALLLLGLAAAFVLAKSDRSEEEKLTYSFILGALALPMVVPHMFIYDLGALVPGPLLLFFVWRNGEKTGAASQPNNAKPRSLSRQFKTIVDLAWFSITAYCLTLVINKTLAVPLLLVAGLLLCYLAAIFVTTRSIDIPNKQEPSDKS
jgi:hypothetical protein